MTINKKDNDDNDNKYTKVSQTLYALEFKINTIFHSHYNNIIIIIPSYKGLVILVYRQFRIPSQNSQHLKITVKKEEK